MLSGVDILTVNETQLYKREKMKLPGLSLSKEIDLTFKVVELPHVYGLTIIITVLKCMKV